MRPSNDEGTQLFKFHFPCNKGERWIYSISLESAISIQKPRNLLKVAYHPVSCLLHHNTFLCFQICFMVKKQKTLKSENPNQQKNLLNQKHTMLTVIITRKLLQIHQFGVEVAFWLQKQAKLSIINVKFTLIILSKPWEMYPKHKEGLQKCSI